MGFFDKVKNMFTEEVEDDVKVEQVKKEVTHVSIETPKIEKFELDELEEKKVEDSISKPIFFDDNDFRDLNLINDEDDRNYFEKDVYNKNQDEQKEVKKVFKPTPIISPVYGILDKNYHKEDIVSRNDIKSISNETDVQPTIDSIRNKAYGTLEDELENTLFGNNSILFKQIKEEVESDEVQLEKLDDDVLSNLTEDIGKELDQLLLKKEKYLSNDEKGNESVTDDLLDFIDSTLYRVGDDEE